MATGGENPGFNLLIPSHHPEKAMEATWPGQSELSLLEAEGTHFSYPSFHGIEKEDQSRLIKAKISP